MSCLSDAPLDNWPGVRADANGRVIGLILNSRDLTGEIPPELGSLANLEQLWIHRTQLSVCVPSSLQGQLDMDRSKLGDLPFC